MNTVNVKKAKITVIGCKSWEPICSIILKDYKWYNIDEHAFARRPFYRLKVGLTVRQIAPAITICDSYFRRAMMADSLVWMVRAPRSISSIPFINDLSLSYVTNQNSIIATKMVNHDKKLSQSIRVISWNPKSKIFEINPKQTNQNSNIKNPPLSLKRRSSYECF